MWTDLSTCKHQVRFEAFQCWGRFFWGTSPTSNNFSGKFHQLFLEGGVDTFPQACWDIGTGDNVPTTPFPEISPPWLRKSRGYHRKPAHWTASPAQIKTIQGNVVGSAVYTVGHPLWPSFAFWEGNDNLISGNQVMLFIRNKRRKIDHFSRFRKCVSGMVMRAWNPSKHWKGHNIEKKPSSLGLQSKMISECKTTIEIIFPAQHIVRLTTTTKIKHVQAGESLDYPLEWTKDTL